MTEHGGCSQVSVLASDVALAEIADLERQLRTAKAKLRGEPASPERIAGNEPNVPASVIREWAAGKGIEVPAIDRVLLKVVEQYEQAHA